jgi:hypothetical protein
MVREDGLRDRLTAGARRQAHRYEWPEIARQCVEMYDVVLSARRD